MIKTFIPNATGVAATDTATLNALLAVIGSNQATIQFPANFSGVCKLNSTTFPPNVPLDFTNGEIQIVTGQTVAIQGPIIAPPKLIFINALSGQGTVVFTGPVCEVYPEWWYAPGASSTIQMAAFQRAVDTGLKVKLTASSGTAGVGYTLNNSTTPLMINNANSCAWIEGSGMNSPALVKFTSAAKAGIQIDFPDAGAPQVLIQNVYLRGAGDGTTFVAGNYGIYVPGFHDGVNHKISNLRIENVQIDRFGDSGIYIAGPTGPVRIDNPVINDIGNYGITLHYDGNNVSPQDVTIDGGSLQGSALGGIAAIASGVGGDNVGSLTIREIDIELEGTQTKPNIYFEQVHGALVAGVTVASLVDTLSVGDANIYLAEGAEACIFQNVLNNVASASSTLNNVSAIGTTRFNKFIGGQHTNKSTATGYLFKQDNLGLGNTWDSALIPVSNFATGHAYAPMKTVENPQANLGTIATTGNTDAYITAPFDAVVSGVDICGTTSLATSNSNYLTFEITNLGQGGIGTTAILAASNANTTKTTGGSALTGDVRRELTVNGATEVWPPTAALIVAKGDRLRVRAGATGTLADTVTFATVTVYLTPLAPLTPP